MNRRKVATRAKTRAETETEEDDLWLKLGRWRE